MKHHFFVAFVYVWFLHVEYIYQFLEDYEIHGDTQIKSESVNEEMF